MIRPSLQRALLIWGTPAFAVGFLLSAMGLALLGRDDASVANHALVVAALLGLAAGAGAHSRLRVAVDEDGLLVRNLFGSWQSRWADIAELGFRNFAGYRAGEPTALAVTPVVGDKPRSMTATLAAGAHGRFLQRAFELVRPRAEAHGVSILRPDDVSMSWWFRAPQWLRAPKYDRWFAAPKWLVRTPPKDEEPTDQLDP